MALKFLSPIDLSQNEILNPVAQNLGTAPSDAVGGQFYFNSTTGIRRLRVYNGTSWDVVGVGDGSVTSVSGSGGTTGLSLSGGPITTSGTLTLGGTLAIANGGTGNTTASTALAALGGVASTLLGVASGVATLDTTGKVPIAQLPDVVLGNLQYIGVWNADTNTPTLADAVGTKGNYYKVTVAGATFGKGWTAGDLCIYNGATWDQVQGGTSDVVSVAGKVGAVELVKADVGLGSVENTALSTWAGTSSITTTGTVTSGTWSGSFGAVSGANLTSLKAANISGQVAIANGGTGSSSASGARSNLSAAVLGANSDITSLSGLTTALSVAQGGTGSTTSAGAKTNLGFSSKFGASFGDGTTTSFAIAHGLGTSDLVVRFCAVSSGQTVEIDYSITSTNITFVLPVAPTTNQYRLIAVG